MSSFGEVFLCETDRDLLRTQRDLLKTVVSRLDELIRLYVTALAEQREGVHVPQMRKCVVCGEERQVASMIIVPKGIGTGWACARCATGEAF